MSSQCPPDCSAKKLHFEKNDRFWKGKQSGYAEVGEPQDMNENNQNQFNVILDLLKMPYRHKPQIIT